MKTKRVVVLSYDPAWQEDFKAITTELEPALHGLIRKIHHVGSTSVEGCSAKPCIDIDIEITDYSVLPAVVRKLAELGYVHEGDLGIKDREAFCYSDKPHLRTHHLYVCPQDSEELRRHIAFRDFLRNNPDAVKQYSAVKEQAAMLFPGDIDRYMQYKSSCVEKLYALCGLA